MTMVLAVDKIVARQTLKILNLEPEKSAKLAGLRYVRADSLSLARKKVGRGFSYFDAHGDRISY